MARYDIAIVGTGPAGLSAALTAKNRNKSILLLGSKTLSLKVEKAHQVNNYLGLPAVTGDNMQKAFLDHIDSMGIEITEDKVNAIYAMGDFFSIQGHKEMYEASSVILATGVATTKEFPGEIENLGRGVSYCATCDAFAYKGKTAIVVGYSKKEEEEAEFLAEVAEKVIYVAMYDEDVAFKSDIEIHKGLKPVSIERDGQMLKLICDTETLEANGVFILRDNVAPSQLVPGLALDKNYVATDRQLKTNIPGLFACGDITGAPFQYIKAAGEGNVAALSAATYLTELTNK